MKRLFLKFKTLEAMDYADDQIKVALRMTGFNEDDGLWMHAQKDGIVFGNKGVVRHMESPLYIEGKKYISLKPWRYFEGFKRYIGAIR